MDAGDPREEDDVRCGGSRDKAGRYNVVVTLSDEQMAAAEGWRAAHGIEDRAEALGELVRLGLLGEVAKIYRLVGGTRSGASRESGKSHA